MKTAKVQVAVLEFICPHCGENLGDKNGSFMFTSPLPETIQCAACGLVSKVPDRAKKLLGDK